MARLILGAALGALMAAPAAADTTLRILHTNDVHARYEETTASGTVCTAKDKAAARCVGGAARLATALKELRGADALYLDAGDQFQGTLLYTRYKDAAALAVLGLLKPDAQVLGNHEFDDGPPVLAHYLDNASWPVLSANTVTEAEPLLAGKVKPSAVVERGARRIGIVGLTTVETPVASRPGPTVSFAAEADSLQAAVNALRAQGIDTIVALTHVGYAVDQALAAAVDGVDVVVGGHSHTLLSNSDAKAAGPYPWVGRSKSGEPVLVVQAGSYGTHLGRLDVTLDAAGVVSAWSGDATLLGNDVPQDPRMLAAVTELAAPLEALRREPVGETTVALSNDCRFAECALGDLIADAMLEAMRDHGAAVAIQNGGGIRAPIPAGTITMGHVLEVLPFSNTLAWADLSGADLQAELENGVGRAHDPQGSGTGRFPQVAGMRFAFDPDRPEGQRVTAVEVRAADGTYAPLDPARTYRVVTNNFVRQGGDGYARFAQATRFYDFGPSLETLVVERIRRLSPIAPAVDGRIARVR